MGSGAPARHARYAKMIEQVAQCAPIAAAAGAAGVENDTFEAALTLKMVVEVLPELTCHYGRSQELQRAVCVREAERPQAVT